MTFAAILARVAAELALFSAVGFLLFAVNDLAVDAIYFGRRLWRSATVYRRFPKTFGRTLAARGLPHFENMEAERGPPMLSRSLERNFSGRDRFSWDHVRLIRKLWRGTLVVKGLLSLEDVRIARERGLPVYERVEDIPGYR